MKIKYLIKENDLTLKQILKQKLNISASLLREIIIENGCTLNGKTVYINSTVKIGDKIVIDLDKTIKETISKKSIYENVPIQNKDKLKTTDIIYEDKYLLIVNKEAFISSHPNANQRYNTLTEKVYNYYKEKNYKYNIHIVNRLDKNTSGICVFAKHKYIQELISKAMKINNIKKEYLAIVYGKPKEKKKILTKKIARKENSIILREVSKLGDEAKTQYEVLSYNKEKNYSVLKIILHTGRTHQIRVHMSNIGHPIIGDDLYIEEAKLKYEIKDICQDINRQALHAKKVKIKIDILNINIDVEAPVPEDIKKLL